MTRRVFASRPFLASTTTTTTSASATPVSAARTIAASSRRFGAKMPGVSTNMTWTGPRIVMPMMRRRVVCTLGETIETFVPTRRLTRVDLPTLGAPTTVT
jgi:hypothetical protein